MMIKHNSNEDQSRFDFSPPFGTESPYHSGSISESNFSPIRADQYQLKGSFGEGDDRGKTPPRLNKIKGWLSSPQRKGGQFRGVSMTTKDPTPFGYFNY